MRRPQRVAATAIVLTLTTSMVSAHGAAQHDQERSKNDPQSTAIVRTGPPPKDWSPGVAPDDVSVSQADLEKAAPRNNEGVSTAWGCNPDTYADNPHTAKNGKDVSGHGWWGKGTCSNNKAWVTTRLYEWYNKSGGGGAFFFKKENRVKVGAKKTSGYKRVNARVKCASKTRTTWMTAVDVDVVSEVDNSERASKKASVACRVP